MKKTSHLRVFGIDPGFGICGYACIELTPTKPLIKTCGVITTPASLSLVERLDIIAHDLSLLLKKYKPDFAGVEQLYFYNNAKTALDVAQARGVILLTLLQHKVTLHELTPLQVKQGLTGDGKADKRQVQKMLTLLFNLPSPPKPDDAADALAVAFVTSQSFSTHQKIKKQG